MEAIVLAGGLGTRLRSAVSNLPKCMAPIGPTVISSAPTVISSEVEKSRPFLSYILDWLRDQGVEHVILSVGYLREHIINWVSAQSYPFDIDFAVEETPLGTGGGIREALKYCRGKQVFVVNGDTFFPVDLKAFTFDAPITVALKPMKGFDRYGAVEMRFLDSAFGSARNDRNTPVNEGGSARNDRVEITGFREKGYCSEGLINGGVYAFNDLDLSGFAPKFSFEKEVLEPLKYKTHGVVQDCYFLDIGIPEDYQRAQTELPEYRAVKAASKKLMESGADTLLIDRDGTINVRIPGDYVRTWAQFKFLSGILEEFPKWAAKFKRIIVVTNQRGVGRGLMTDRDLADIHSRMLQAIVKAGGRIDAILTCTATDDADPRRKPNPGMYREAKQLFPEMERAIMLGDSRTDAAFAQNAGIDFILL